MEPGKGRRFLIDGSMATGGGGFTYLVNIIPHLALDSPEDRFLVLVRSPRIAASMPYSENIEIVVLPEAGLVERLRFLWFEASKRADSWGADLYYSAGEYVPPFARCPVVASFQNPNVFTTLKQGWPWRQRLRLKVLRLLASVSARLCRRILFVSRDSARWMGDSIALPEAKRKWLHHGIDLAVWQPQAPRETDLGSPILSVSSIYRYKNYVRLIEAWVLLANRRSGALPDLVIVGENLDDSYAAKMDSARAAAGELAGRIHFLGGVLHSEIRRYYASASIFVFPSYLETFGIPMIEAMASKLPLVASDIPVFREIAEDSALFFDPHDVESIADAMEQALFNVDVRASLVQRGSERVRQFTWGEAAARLRSVFDEVLAEASEAEAGK
jgi:glycosyltransferase involved in cell wall biosynthesis